ncbi:MAG: hypothetical protein IPQ07_16940 [Myxococcales bacterium]|nr:hypothetical protein [Myxococcales bacterium]
MGLQRVPHGAPQLGGPEGTATTVEVFRSRWLWHVDVKIASARHRPPKDRRAPHPIRIDGHAVKYDRAGKKDPTAD